MRNTITLGRGLILCGCLLSALLGPRIFGADSGFRPVLNESILFQGTNWAPFAAHSLKPGTLVLRSAYATNLPGVITYQEGVDFVLLAESGLVRRSASSRIPDFLTCPLAGTNALGKSSRDYGDINRFLVWASYEGIVPASADDPLRDEAVHHRVPLAGQTNFTIVAFGDSVMLGYMLRVPVRAYPYEYANHLRRRLGHTKITLLNRSVRGDTTEYAVDRVRHDVCSLRPDLVIVGFGVNDMYQEPYGIPPAKYKENLTLLVNTIVSETGAEVLLVSPPPPNPRWSYYAGEAAAFERATRSVALATGCAYADAYHAWVEATSRKQPESLYSDGINHPCEFGHGLMLGALLKATENPP